MASLNRLTALSTEIAGKTKIITDYLSSKGLEAASFDVNGLYEFPISSEDEEPFNARLELIAATRELHAIVLGPKEFLRSLAWDVGKCLPPNHSSSDTWLGRRSIVSQSYMGIQSGRSCSTHRRHILR
jgi:hypothetical protein